MTECPYCGFAAHTTREEVAHMEQAHPDIVAERLRAAGLEPSTPPISAEMREAAQRSLERRRETAPEPVDNADREAGEPMVFYCQLCAWPADVLPEDFFMAIPRRYCGECQAGVQMGVLSSNSPGRSEKS